MRSSMRKSERHQLIKWMIKEEKLGTQKDIQKLRPRPLVKV